MNVRAVAKWAVVAGVAVVLWLVAVYVRGMSASAPKLPPPAFDVDVPAGQEFADASGSAHFHFDATVRLGNRTPGGMREVIVDVMVTNKTTDPVRHLSIGGILDDQVVQVIEAQVPFFGTATDEDHNLIPGQVPYGVSVSRIAYTLDPDRLSPAGKREVLRALQAPIRLKLRWDAGTEYIQVHPVVTSGD